MFMEDNAKPKVSVVIPTYGRALMVRQAVLAALAQELEPTEVIVSDDQSPDDTFDILNKIAENFPALKVIRSTTNSGGVENWNRVIDEANGDYIAYCSDDDYFLPHHLKMSVGFLEQHPEIALVHSGFINLTESNLNSIILSVELIENEVKITHGQTVLKHIIKQTSYPFQPSTFVFRRSLWKSAGHFDSSYTVADTDWFIRVGLAHRIAYLPFVSVVNRRHEGNWSNRVGSIGMNIEFHKIMQSAFCNINNTGFSRGLNFLKAKWLATEVVKFIRIYVSRSRAGLFEISRDCADAIWGIVFKYKRGYFYIIYVILAASTSRLLRLIQCFLPGGNRYYRGLGKDCPK